MSDGATPTHRRGISSVMAFAQAHAAFLRHAYSEAATLYGNAVDSAALSPSERASALCNRAACYAEMELNRKVLNDADAALKLDGNCLRALLLKGTAQHNMGKVVDAKKTWQLGVESASGDIALVAELARLCTSAGGVAETNSEAIPPASSTAAPPAAAPQPAATLPRPATSTPLTTPATALPTPKTAPTPKPTPAAPAAPTATNPALAMETYQRAVSCANGGEYTKAVALFTSVLELQPGRVAALSGRGTAYAYSGRLPEALADFDAALAENSDEPDLLGRKLQVINALERWDDVVQCATALLRRSPRDLAALHMRAKAYHSLQNYRRSVRDFRALLEGRAGDPGIYNLLGTALAAMGRCADAIEIYGKTLSVDPSLFQAHVNIGQAHRDLAQVDEAEASFSKALAAKPDFAPGRHRRALLRHGVGQHALAITDLEATVRIEPEHDEARDMLALSHAALGDFRHALGALDELLARRPSHWSFHHRVVVALLASHLHVPRDDYPLDALVPPDIKHGTSKQLAANPAAREAASKSGAMIDANRAPVLSPPRTPPPSAEAATVLRAAAMFAACMQVRAKGFVPNARLQRQAGIAVIEVAQRVKALLATASSREVAKVGKKGGVRQEPNGIGSGRGGGADAATTRDAGAVDVSDAERGLGAMVAFGWRDIYDVAVRWRQLGEPADNVWWIDGMPRHDFEEGFGSHTPILKGQHETVRYYPQYGRVLAAIKELAADQWSLNGEQQAQLASATDCLAVRKLRGKDDYVVSPCVGVVGGVLEGTRLTVQDAPPEGVDVSIRTPLTPSRWASYHPEMAAAWEAYARAPQLAPPHRLQLAVLSQAVPRPNRQVLHVRGARQGARLREERSRDGRAWPRHRRRPPPHILLVQLYAPHARIGRRRVGYAHGAAARVRHRGVRATARGSVPRLGGHPHAAARRLQGRRARVVAASRTHAPAAR